MSTAAAFDVSSEAASLVELRDLIANGTARSIRRSLKLSVREVARSVDASPSTVSEWERGLQRPTGKQALRYHRLLLDLDAHLAVPLSGADRIDAAMSTLASHASVLARTCAAGSPTLGTLRSARSYLESVRTVMDWLVRRAIEGEDLEPRPSRAAIDEEFGLPPGGAGGAGLSAGWGIGEPGAVPSQEGLAEYLAEFDGDELDALFARLCDTTRALAWTAYRLEWPITLEDSEPVATAIGIAVGLFNILRERVPDVAERPARQRGDCLDPLPLPARRASREEAAA